VAAHGKIRLSVQNTLERSAVLWELVEAGQAFRDNAPRVFMPLRFAAVPELTRGR